jgi:hypothetical protein
MTITSLLSIFAAASEGFAYNIQNSNPQDKTRHFDEERIDRDLHLGLHRHCRSGVDRSSL